MNAEPVRWPLQPLTIRSEWSTPADGLAARAFDHHLTAYADWLTTAGAEPRLAIVLCAGPGARDRFVAGLDFDRVDVVHAPATPARPLHPKLLAHQGDHFNTLLYVVDGFESGDPTELFAALQGRVGVLTGAATWVAIVIESVEALCALYDKAPRLAAEARRRVLVVGEPPTPAPPAPDALRDRWLRDNRIAELVFHHLATPDTPPSPLDFGRLVRSGYVDATVGAKQHPERQRLAALWRAGADGPLPFPAAQAGRAAAIEAARRLGDRLATADRAALDATLSGDPDARLAAGLAADGIHGALAHLAAVGRGEASGGPALITRLDGLLTDAAPALRAHGQQAIAAAAAALGDLDRCESALAAAADAARAAGLIETWFEVTEKQVQIHTFLDRRTHAREALDRLEALTPALCSPFWAARLLLARGEFIAGLDAARAAEELSAAERTFAAHGYPEWAELAADGAK